ncbi:MAG: PilZ domain-containing protein [Myxococcales bacterium]|nr:PilZ domain-containing protein [Myxococcales bacterium]MCZ6715357.1 PilZ domain-containing protein [Deltaproteobacteria bacterium]TDJ00326.1 MAG: hypothetical protein E2O73_06090 [Deltaproteobacteria bacterium]TDJ10142.1 MAG: hypothetical protein E2O71_00155 [Deltaproteobacteria bacterium]
MSEKPSVERRRLKRVVKRIPARYQCEGMIGKGHIKNVTQEGLFLRTDRLPSPGARIRLVFEPEDGPKVEVSGTVRWTTGQLRHAADTSPGFGMRIENVSEEFLEFFENILLH